jgi:hypothetical protein
VNVSTTRGRARAGTGRCERLESTSGKRLRTLPIRTLVRHFDTASASAPWYSCSTCSCELVAGLEHREVGRRVLRVQLAGRVEHLVEPVVIGEPGLLHLAVVLARGLDDLGLVRQPHVAAVGVERDARHPVGLLAAVVGRVHDLRDREVLVLDQPSARLAGAGVRRAPHPVVAHLRHARSRPAAIALTDSVRAIARQLTWLSFVAL